MKERQFAPSPNYSPAALVVRELIGQHPIERTATELATAERLNQLERQAPELVRIAREDAGADIEYLGIAGLPDGPTFYEAPDGVGWVLLPGSIEEAVAPRPQMETIQRVSEALYFPSTFVAHEVTPEMAANLQGQAGPAGLKLRPSEVAEVVPPVPPPAEAIAEGERMAQRSQQIVDAAKRTGKLIIGTISIPASAAAAVVTAAATLDPLVMGVIPAGPEHPGAPAAWYLIAKWDW